MVVSIGDMTKDVVTPMDCHITMIDLGPTTKKQEFLELDDTVKTIRAQLDRTIEKKEMLENENRRLKEYIEGMDSHGREDPTFVSPIAIDHRFPFESYEAVRNTHLEVTKCIEGVAK